MKGERTQRCIKLGWQLRRLRGCRQRLERQLLNLLRNARILVAEIVPDCRRQHILALRINRAYKARDWRWSLSLAWNFNANFGMRHVGGRRALINWLERQACLVFAPRFPLEVGRHCEKLYCIVACSLAEVARRLERCLARGTGRALWQGAQLVNSQRRKDDR